MRWSVIAAAVLVVACGTGTPPKVAVTVSPDEVQQLAGRWSGSYDSMATGRHGSIVFTLEAAGDTARGDVVMIAEGERVPMTPDGHRPINAPIARAVNIQFVVISGNDVSGTLAPYEDPNSHALLSTTFVGRVDGDRIKGTFVTWGGATAGPQRGTWSVRRSHAG
jgi:hypothetical protein